MGEREGKNKGNLVDVTMAESIFRPSRSQEECQDESRTDQHRRNAVAFFLS